MRNLPASSGFKIHRVLLRYFEVAGGGDFEWNEKACNKQACNIPYGHCV